MPFDSTPEDNGGGGGGDHDPHDRELMQQLLNATKMQAEINLASTGVCPACFWAEVALNAVADCAELCDDDGLAQFQIEVAQALATAKMEKKKGEPS